MAMRDLPDMYARGPQVRGLRAYISGKSQMGMLQVYIMYHFLPIATTPVVLIPQVMVKELSAYIHLLYSGNTLYMKPCESL